jgi:hypothetical protein
MDELQRTLGRRRATKPVPEVEDSAGPASPPASKPITALPRTPEPGLLARSKSFHSSASPWRPREERHRAEELAKVKEEIVVEMREEIRRAKEEILAALRGVLLTQPQPEG